MVQACSFTTRSLKLNIPTKHPFELLFGTQINNKTDLRIQQLIDEQLQLEFNENRELLRKAAKSQIIKVQNENKKSYNLRRKSPCLYSVKDLVAIKRTQHGPGQKLCNKFISVHIKLLR
ncbi:transposon Ty3-G Gag-Pol polyprotein [Trichonephila inaurata madagascariensis]|uniref:Transposon Ty3-G Gag-Pol polyprotein n=1 Tax=Trichonephila inaurata madagascariensis TaxID=2747483 RepID=A0A8X7CED4_9ARAC|nr:transposon Ty3-G Gag-Pol polyprotein [Trichonephila inaurata madagascariensis]